MTKARQVDELAAEVANASNEQTHGIVQINAAVGEMDKVTQSNAASAEETAAAAEELNAQAGMMKQAVIELLQLVGGSGLEEPKPAAKTAGNSVRMFKPTVKAPTAIHSNGHAASPADKSAANRRQEIPLEGDFKDF